MKVLQSIGKAFLTLIGVLVLVALLAAASGYVVYNKVGSNNRNFDLTLKAIFKPESEPTRNLEVKTMAVRRDEDIAFFNMSDGRKYVAKPSTYRDAHGTTEYHDFELDRPMRVKLYFEKFLNMYICYTAHTMAMKTGEWREDYTCFEVIEVIKPKD
ncbi:hypothetical protein [Paraferrimonas sedimenticola]|uniref:Uncharacterized protein n=1 Tax=Paraferrimonas sedimenticola TaxID=375674 RepID=A0AA37RXJ7_9GAMM|nr:hypothetical protein [Paraferrimonas sedimenticola]GLP96976.1 hypothetical protein GCM10007895_22820 [Paraferrimonas sedimenticola]